MSCSKTASLWMIALGVMVFATGCPEGGPKVYQVTGSVTIGGQPAPNEVTVNFQPVDPKGILASGTVNNGTYELYSGTEGKKGAPAGKYKVYLMFNTSAQGAAAMEAMKGGGASGGPPAAPAAPFPAEYGSASTSPLAEVEVKTSGSNKIDVPIP